MPYSPALFLNELLTLFYYKILITMDTIQIAVKDFLSHCKYEKNLSEKTLKAYSIDLTQLIIFLKTHEHSEMIVDINKTVLREYLENISTLKPKSIKRKIATIKAMFNFLEFEDKIITNPFRKMRIRIKEPKRLPKVMNLREIKKMFTSAYQAIDAVSDKDCYTYRERLRNVVVLELLFATGARVSEVAGLKKDNIDLKTGYLTIRGKGNKERFIQICNKETLDVLREYYKFFRPQIEKIEYLLVNRLGNKLSDQSIRNIVKYFSANAGIGRHITPHVFRHSFATLLLEKDVDIKYIQTLLGHSSILTTQIYTHVNREKQKKILRTKHPRKDFSMQIPPVI